MENKKLSLLSAILININIMLGSGIFINMAIIPKLTGILAPIAYLIVGLLLLPIVISFSRFWKINNSGATFYQLSFPISPYLGFLSSWSYFIGKISSCALGIHICMSILQKLFSTLVNISTIYLDSITIIIFTLLNLLNIRIGKSIQYTFIILKFVPIFFTIIFGFFLIFDFKYSPEFLPFNGLPYSLTLILYAFAGFEASCSLSNSIENPKKNGPKAMIISYLIVMLIVVTFQTILVLSLYDDIFKINSYLDVFGKLVSKIFKRDNFNNYLIAILYSGVATSSLGAAYGILFSNSWNLFVIAKDKKILFSKYITMLNKYNTAYIAIIIEGILAITYLLISKCNQIALQQVSASATIITYTITMITFLFSSLKNKNTNNTILASIAICICIILFISTILNIKKYGISLLFSLFLLIIIFGSYMFKKMTQYSK